MFSDNITVLIYILLSLHLKSGYSKCHKYYILMEKSGDGFELFSKGKHNWTVTNSTIENATNYFDINCVLDLECLGSITIPITTNKLYYKSGTDTRITANITKEQYMEPPKKHHTITAIPRTVPPTIPPTIPPTESADPAIFPTTPSTDPNDNKEDATNVRDSDDIKDGKNYTLLVLVNDGNKNKTYTAAAGHLRNKEDIEQSQKVALIVCAGILGAGAGIASMFIITKLIVKSLQFGVYYT